MSKKKNKIKVVRISLHIEEVNSEETFELYPEDDLKEQCEAYLEHWAKQSVVAYYNIESVEDKD